MSTISPTQMSAIRCHHDDDEIRNAVEFDRLRLMATYSRGYSIACDCSRDRRLDVADCAGLSVFNRNAKPVARFSGRQYVALENSDRTICIYSRLVRNLCRLLADSRAHCDAATAVTLTLILRAAGSRRRQRLP